MLLDWSEAALRDREDIFRYIAIEGGSPDAGLRIDDLIYQQVQRLKTFPYSGRSGRIDGTREIIIGSTPYLAVYKVDDDRVLILRVLHGAREWP
ncbi:addiction module toxin, RelE/StbE family [Devosia enhydra]|uniref:Addiction module toxin, RelE/StbE family n=1 Tax=Devosia enhydra TaxID=665118 RepID=A0A1K2I188_9HYPH|nr:type II toxin-antitoxin system mRNA interferase toxin, RelE/StbE family [Devosia enhydra]SFZ86154.1 addiction module toxin, RelE/StbE family [Devosia enhydra]